MRKSLFVVAAALLCLALIVPVWAQDATPEVTPEGEMTDLAGAQPGDPGIVVEDQVSLNGMVTIASVTADSAGFIVIHADENGQPGHVVGVSPVAAGATENLSIMIDGAMATPVLHAMFHIDDGQPGVFEWKADPSLDAPLSGNVSTFTIAAIVAFDQQPIENTVIIASVISPDGGWLVISADDNGQPGQALGQALVNPGTNPSVIVPLAADGQTPVLWASLAVDDGEIGTFEAGQVEGADAPFSLNGQSAMHPINVAEAPTLLLTDGTPLEIAQVPYIIPAANQVLDTSAPGASGEILIESAFSVGQGFIDVHADDGGHPGVSIGVAPLADGEQMGVIVPVGPPPTMPDMVIPPMVWPMLHSDTNANGVYEYLMIVGADLPVVYNGAVVTVPLIVGPTDPGAGGGMATDEAGMATDEAGMPTDEAGMATDEAGMATDEAVDGGDVTSEAGIGGEGEATAEAAEGS